MGRMMAVEAATTGRFRFPGARGVCVVGIAIVVAFLAPRADAIQARVSLPNGDVYTGEWLRSDGSQFRIRLDDG